MNKSHLVSSITPATVNSYDYQIYKDHNESFKKDTVKLGNIQYKLDIRFQ